MSVEPSVTLPWPPKELSPNARWTQAMDNELRSLHGKLPITKIAQQIGKTSGSVRARITVLGIAKRIYWTREEEELLRNAYLRSGAGGVLDLDGLAKQIGRHKTNVSRKARGLGLSTNYGRKKVEQRKDRRVFKGDDAAFRKHISDRTKRYLKEKGHPRGALGMKHTAESRAKLSISSKAAAARVTEEQRAEINLKIMQTRTRNGTYAHNKPHGSWKAQWQEIGGKRKYFRSNWEANYARYLEWLKGLGHIKDWEHEPKTFWFEGVKRGSVSYLPDFRVIENNGSEVFHEVKGWMDDRSKTKIARMKRYYPDVVLVVIDSKAYRELRLKVSSLVPGWTDIERDRRGA